MILTRLLSIHRPGELYLPERVSLPMTSAPVLTPHLSVAA
jgi:hypothetical protein